MSLMNRMANAKNPFQGKAKKVLCVCSAGLLRSPTAAFVLGQEPFNFNTRSAGVFEDFALIPVDEVLIEWADEIVCMSKEHEEILKTIVPKNDDGTTTKPIFCLNVPDIYEFKNPDLMKLIAERYVLETTGWSDVA